MALPRMSLPTVALVSLIACTPPDEGPETTDSTTSNGGSATSDVTLTTISLPTGGPSTSGSTGVTDSTGLDSTDEGTTATVTGTEETGSTTAGEESSTGDPVYEVSWCILQFPPSVVVSVDEVFTVYTRLFADGLTNLTGDNDPSPELVVEVGYGLDGSDPSMGAAWTYVSAIPNVGWGPGAPDYSPDNDEYQADLSIDMPGVYDYAARISGDGGATWVYCDLDDLLNGGYTPDQAGHAEVGQVL